MKVKSLSRVQLLATSWTAAHLAPPSMGFSRQEYWSGVPLPSLPGLAALKSVIGYSVSLAVLLCAYEVQAVPKLETGHDAQWHKEK